MEKTVRDLSEDELLASFLPLLPRGRNTEVPTGDDAAVIAAPDGRYVVTTDVLVEDRHFRRHWGSAEDVGWRAAAQNLADVAAMGAVPTSLVISLVLPPQTPVAWVQGFARGLAQLCEPVGVGVDGGDLSSGAQIVAAVTAHGTLQGRAPVLRSTARPGDVLAHAGVLGHAAAGYALLNEAGDTGPETEAVLADLGVEAATATMFRRVFLRPDPPLQAGPAAAMAGASAMMDVSDGLLRDAGRLARASRSLIDLSSAALAPAVTALEPVSVPLGLSALDWVLSGGEDHGLLATFPPGTAVPPPFRPLGTVSAAGSGGHAHGAVLLDGTTPDVARPGWDHFAG
ncbi:thiamine-phosphate kinase [Bogoriella caseilytica]|nr:thiamine-phosphate kinase [Bogoriella caseilytica]